MQAHAFWKAVTVDRSDVLDGLLGWLQRERIPFCVIGGAGINAYVEPVVTLDLDLVVAAPELERIEPALSRQFQVVRFPHSVNVSREGSDVRVQFQTDPRYRVFLDRATTRDVLGLSLPVARAEDLLQGKIWAVQDPERRASKRQKDLADIARLIERFPALRSDVPADVLARLF